jgi:hypothetical protein
MRARRSTATLHFASAAAHIRCVMTIRTNLGSRVMSDVSTFRLYVLRATYLLIVVGLGCVIWPGIIHHSSGWALKYGDESSLLAGVSVLALLGLRYPLKMLPLLLFELTWKSIWLLAIALPLWSAGQADAATWETINACVMGVVIFPLAIPWPYVWANFVKARGDRWKTLAR